MHTNKSEPVVYLENSNVLLCYGYLSTDSFSFYVLIHIIVLQLNYK